MDKKVISIDPKLILMVAWFLPLALNFIGLIIVWVFKVYFENEKSDRLLIDGFKHIVNAFISIFVILFILGVISTIFSFIIIIGWIANVFIYLAMGLIIIYAIIISIIGALEAAKGRIYRPLFNIDFIR